MNLSHSVWRSFFQRLRTHLTPSGFSARRVRRRSSQRAFGAVRQVQSLEPRTVLSGASITNLAITEAGVGQPATLSGDFSDVPTDQILTLDVDWGDGTTETFHYAPGTTDFSETHHYTKPSANETDGHYDVSVTLSFPNVREVGDEFLVNTETSGPQMNSEVAVASDGSYVIAWESDGQDGDSSGIYAQRYNSDGTTAGDEFLVNTETDDRQDGISIAMADDGRFVIAWHSNLQDGDSFGVYAQLYNADGTTTGDEFLVNTTTTSAQLAPAVGMANDGSFVVSWASHGQDGDNDGVYARRYNADGTTNGDEFHVSTETAGPQSAPTIAVAGDSRFVIAWQSLDQDGDLFGVYAQRYNADGTLAGDEFLVNTQTASSQDFPSVAIADDGRFVIAWASDGQDGSGTGVFAQRYNADGTTAGDEFQVNTYTTDRQQFPSVAMTNDGGFMIAWASDDQDGNDLGVFARRYNSDGAPLGHEILVNSYVVGSQTSPSLGLNDVGDVVITWSSQIRDGDDFGVYAQRYDALSTVPPATETTDVTVLQSGVTIDPITTSIVEGGTVTATGDFENLPAGVPIKLTIDWGDGTVETYDYDAGSTSYSETHTYADDSGDETNDEFIINVYLGEERTTTPSSETLVSNTTSGGQGDPFITVAPDGGFLITWESGSTDDVHAQRFAADGTEVGDRFTVEGALLDRKLDARAGFAADGSYVLMWAGGDGDAYGVHAQRFAADGTEVGDPILVNTTTEDNQAPSSLAVAADGSFIATWSSNNSDDNFSDTYFQRFSADGTKIGGETLVNTHLSASQFYSQVAIAGDGSFVITWTSEEQDGHGDGIYAQRFAADGTTIGDEFLVNTATTSDQKFPAIGMADDGSFVITWEGTQGVRGAGIYAQRFAADGTTVGDEFLVNTDWHFMDQTAPSIAMAANGNFLITWTSEGQDGDQEGIYGQQFAADGTELGLSFLVNTTTSGSQTQPTVAATPDGDFMITWDSRSPSPGIMFRTFPGRQGVFETVEVTNADPVVTVTSVVTGPNGHVTINGTLSDPGTQDRLQTTIHWGEVSDPIFFDPGTTTFSVSHNYPTDDGKFQYTVLFTVSDGDGGSTEQQSVNVVFENQAPTLTATPDTTLDYQEGFAPVTLFDEVTITDPDDTELSQATVQITEGYASGRDVLAGSADGPKIPGGSISISFDETTGTLTLSGNATVAEYVTALKSVTFYTAGGLDPSTRTVTLTITDANGVADADGTKTATDTRLLSLTPQSINSVPFNGPAEQQWETAISDGAAGDPDPRMWDPSRTYIDTQVGTLDGTTVIYTRGAHSGIWYVSTLDDGQFTPEVAWGVWEGWKKDPNRWQDVIIGDVNGDGASDVLGLTRNNGLWLMTANSARDGFDEEVYLGQLLQRESWTDLNATDVNGDGRDDIVIRSQSGGGWWTLVRNDANDGFAAPAWQQEWDTTQTWVDVHAVDLNNDGNTDLIGRSLESGEWVAMLAKADGTGFKNEQVIATWDSSRTYADVTVQDVDGDGTVDLLARTEETGEWHVSNGLTNGTIYAVSAANTWASWDAIWQLKQPWINTTFGDYNGDGKLDLITQARTGASWWMMLANDAGDGFEDAFAVDMFNPTITWSNLTAVDVNGDLGPNSTPKMDLIGLASGRTGWWIAESDPTSSDAARISARPSNDGFDPDAEFRSMGRGDFNGDGRVDLLAQEADTGAWWVMLGGDTDSGYLSPQKWATLGKGWQLARTWNRAVIGDVNGDGRDDVLIDHDRNGMYVMIANGTGDGFEKERWVRNINSQIDELFLLDVNGDGRDDIASFNDLTDQWFYAAALTDSIGFERMTRSQMWVAPQWNNPRWDDFQVGDVNGDGRDDVIGRSKTANGMYVMLASTRINGFEDEQWVGRFPSDENLGTILVADVTGDGRDDIIAWSKTDGDWLVMASTDGTDLFDAPTTWATWSDWRLEQPWEVFLTGDVNRDGKLDIYAQSENEGWWLMLSTGTNFEAPRYMRHS